jgi:hypothetical protein
MTTDIGTTHPNAKVHARRWWILAILSLSVFLVVVDNLIINVAIPTLARELEATTSTRWCSPACCWHAVVSAIVSAANS